MTLMRGVKPVANNYGSFFDAVREQLLSPFTMSLPAEKTRRLATFGN